MKNEKSRWLSHEPREFATGDIICNADRQDNIRLVVGFDDFALYCINLVHCALTENCEPHPIYPMYYDEIESGVWPKLLKLGSLENYTQYIDDVRSEVIEIQKQIMSENE